MLSALLPREHLRISTVRSLPSNRFKPNSSATDTIRMNLNIPQADLLARMMDVAQLRHRLISRNLANVNTPGYHQLEVSFEDAFSHALSKQGEGAALHIAPKVVEGQGNVPRQDGNTVDLDKELGNLNKNGLTFGMASQLLVGRIGMMRSAILGH